MLRELEREEEIRGHELTTAFALVGLTAEAGTMLQQLATVPRLRAFERTEVARQLAALGRQEQAIELLREISSESSVENAERVWAARLLGEVGARRRGDRTAPRVGRRAGPE
jgi:hypothetical protein